MEFPGKRPALYGLVLAASLLGSGTALADDPEAEVRAALAADPDGGIRTLKAGEATQERRFEARKQRLDRNTRDLVEGRTAEAQVLRERGNVARHARKDIQTREMFDQKLADGTGASGTTSARSDVERLGHHPDELDQLQRSGEQARARRGYPGREVSRLADGRTPEAQELNRRGEIARRNRGVALADAPHAHAGAGPRRAPDIGPGSTPGARPRAGGLARGVAGGLVAGWAVETATGVHVPDAIDAVQWTADTMQRPQDTPERVGQLAVGAVDLTGQLATSLTRPDRMAVNLANGTVGVANTTAHMITHPKDAVAAVGNTAVGTAHLAADVGTGLGKGVVTVANHGARAVTHPARTANAVGKGVVKAANGTARAVGTVGNGLGKLVAGKR